MKNEFDNEFELSDEEVDDFGRGALEAYVHRESMISLETYRDAILGLADCAQHMSESGHLARCILLSAISRIIISAQSILSALMRLIFSSLSTSSAAEAP
ncbi:hypothetical protein QWY84_16765 [Aquisalimonas lutea]|uniref:hypothetical protein n=1 Tax=Aquisalimonas lutea TaxID=1327750 RepID=UPI0025B3737E|nr:hypothetical protein [Aquisalimonas lutea]MDN3519269.1 hypothetical protein [Aquisalimonas lutea]